MPLRFSIKWLLVAAVYVAIVGAALKQGWWLWADLLWGVGWTAWGYAALTACFRSGAARAGAIGFALLAACYAVSLHFAPATLPTARLLNAIGIEERWDRIDMLADEDDLFGEPAPLEPAPDVNPTSPDDPFVGYAIQARAPSYWEQKLRAAHSSGAMLAGLIGLLLGLVVWWQSQKRIKLAGVTALVTLTVLMATSAAFGQDGPITYVDATDGQKGNTRLASGEEFVPRADLSAGNDDRWSLRPYGNGASVYTANDGRPAGPEDAPQLVTTITGLTAGERYGVFIYFWTDSHNWQIQASLEPPAAGGAEVPAVTPPGDGSAAEATPDLFNSEVMVEELNRQLMQASLGKVAANDQGEIHVWIDDVPGSTSATRTWYDGVGYVEQPEPPPVEVGSLLDWWPWIVMLAVGFIVFIMIAARRRERGSMIDDATAQ